jgi:hypothetical protein
MISPECNPAESQVVVSFANDTTTESHSLFPSAHSCANLFFRLHNLDSKGALAMEWVTPQHEEIELSCEISSYANAEL